MNGNQFIYIADPMCSWCWGFSPVIDLVREHVRGQMPILLLMGGLRPGTTEAMDEEMKSRIRGHWEQVQAATGQPFDPVFFEREEFIYDTEPPCRAIVAVRHLDEDVPFVLLKGIQRAFYTRNQDVTRSEVLKTLAEAAGINGNFFESRFESGEVRALTLRDFETVRQAGINGFPALLAGNDIDGYSFIASGYLPWELVERKVESWLKI